MNSLQIFNNAQFGEIRTVEDGCKVLFCGSDVAKALGYDQPHKAIKQHCKEDGGMIHTVTDSLGRIQKAKFIDEGNLYRLIINSKLPSAEKFERWVFDEVLPTIRRTGTYTAKPADATKVREVEARLNNSRARVSSMWLKLAERVSIPEYRQICASYASQVLAGHEVIPLPVSAERYYTATEVGSMLGVTSQRIGIVANQNNIKTDEYGKLFFDKSQYSNKEVQTFKYNDQGVKRLGELLGKQTA